jgi:type IV/VI secretion system ImpK/VasF family protein
MARLFDCFAAFFRFGLELDAAIAAGRVESACVAAQRRARELLDEARAAARTLEIPDAQIESASFAAVAWIDEILERHPDWAATMVPLQLRLFNANDAPVEFFHHLSALPADDQAVREVYWHALVFGFKGQYYFESGEGGELGKLKDLHALQLPVRPLALDGLAHEHITPQPYVQPDPAGPRDPQRRERALLRVGAVLVVLVPLAYLLASWLAGPKERAPTLAQRVEHRLQAYACADLAASVAGDGSMRVSGFVPLPEEIQRVERDVRAIAGVGQTSFDLQVRIWPHCEVVAILKPYRARNREQRQGLKVAAGTAREGRLREGDQVLFQVTNNAQRAGYLWVDYYTADGAVMHLNAGPRQPQVAAGETIELGRDIPASWLVTPPFGTVLLTALSSPTPFGEAAERPPFELASAYLQRLRESVANSEFGARLVADFMFLETVSR